MRSEEWNSYDHDSSSYAKDSFPAEKKIANFEGPVKDEGFKNKLREKELEVNNLRAANHDVYSQVKVLQETLQKKEKEISKISYEKEIYLKAEEEIRRAQENARAKELKLNTQINEITKTSQELAKANRKLTRENTEILKESSEIRKENSELKELYDFIEAEKKHFESELKEAEKLIQRLQKTLKLKEDAIMDLHHSRSNLEKELFSLTQSNFLKDSEKKFDFKRLQIPDRRGLSTSPERPNFIFTDRPDETSYKVMCNEAMKIVGVSSNKDFYSKLLHLKQYHSKYKKSRRLIDKISDLIVQCSPMGFFSKEPNSHQIWRWITRLLEEYMRIKQSVVGEGFNKLCELLQTDSVELMAAKIEQLQKPWGKHTQ